MARWLQNMREREEFWSPWPVCFLCATAFLAILCVPQMSKARWINDQLIFEDRSESYPSCNNYMAWGVVVPIIWNYSLKHYKTHLHSTPWGERSTASFVFAKTEHWPLPLNPNFPPIWWKNQIAVTSISQLRVKIPFIVLTARTGKK